MILQFRCSERSADARRSVDFWMTALAAYDTAASAHSMIPDTAARPAEDAEIPTTTAPPKETAIPASKPDEKPSPSSQPLSSAISTGPVLVIIAAVPASTFCSPQLSATM